MYFSPLWHHDYHYYFKSRGYYIAVWRNKMVWFLFKFFYIMRVCGVSIVIFEALLTILERKGWYFNLTQSNKTNKKISCSICQNLFIEKTIGSGKANKWKHKKYKISEWTLIRWKCLFTIFRCISAILRQKELYN